MAFSANIAAMWVIMLINHTDACPGIRDCQGRATLSVDYILTPGSFIHDFYPTRLARIGYEAGMNEYRRKFVGTESLGHPRCYQGDSIVCQITCTTLIIFPKKEENVKSNLPGCPSGS